MKTIAYTALHYGSDYLAYAIRSVIDHVNEYHVLYSAVGSHGSRTDALCPDTRQQLKRIAEKAAGNKLHWHDGEWAYEGQQRDTIHQIVPDADAILILDADEIWTKPLVEHAIDRLEGYNASRHLLVAPIHYWRSLHKCILHDPAAPVRVIYPKFPEGTVLDGGKHIGRCINHMGYAQRSEIVRYKLLTHGHRGEFRRDCDWFSDVFMNTARTTDLHVVGSEYWNAEPVNPLDYMPAWMADHPYFNLSVIP